MLALPTVRVPVTPAAAAIWPTVVLAFEALRSRSGSGAGDSEFIVTCSFPAFAKPPLADSALPGLNCAAFWFFSAASRCITRFTCLPRPCSHTLVQGALPSSSVAQGSYQRNALVIAIVQLLQLSESVTLFSETPCE